jgi:zinc transporter, ZIP family
VMQLMHVNKQLGHKELVAWMLLAGLFLGFATDFIIEAAGV